MKSFFVKTFEDRNLCIKAESFDLSYSVYNFYTGEGIEKTLVACVSTEDVLAVIQEDNFECDFYHVNIDDIEGEED